MRLLRHPLRKLQAPKPSLFEAVDVFCKEVFAETEPLVLGTKNRRKLETMRAERPGPHRV